jgi:hypothetical protein
MDDLQSELKELKQFIADLKADRVAAKEKEQRESWTKYVSLSVVIIAVFSGIDAQWAGKYGSMAQMSQVRASDEWNYYQAQSLKQHLFEVTRRQIPKSTTDPEALQQQKEYEAKIAEYEKRKAESTTKAKKLEDKRDYAGQVGAKLGLALTCFSVSIAMASICMMSKKKPLWFLAMALAAFGVVQMIVAKSIPMP